MNRRESGSGVLCCCVAAVLCLAPACSRQPTPAGAQAGGGAAPVRVMRVERSDIGRKLELTGDVRPLSTVVLTSKVAGRLERLGIMAPDGGYTPLSEGLAVRRGDVLAQIDLEVYETRFKQSQAAAEMARAQFNDAAREEQRIAALYREGAVTEQARDKAATARMIAEAGLAQAEAALALAKIEFSEATPRSPVDGVVTRKHVDEGNIVSASTPLATIEEISRVKVLFGVPERYAAGLVPGATTVRLRSEAMEGEAIEATVAKVYPSVDLATRNVTVEVLLENGQGLLRPGGFVLVEMEADRVEGAVVIPFSAVVWQGAVGFVFVAENGKARRRPVRLGIREAERCEVVSGLEPGELLITDGVRDLRDGDAIEMAGGGRE